MQNQQMHGYIPTLNGWRAFSIIYVLIFHASWLYLNPISGLFPNAILWSVIEKGVMGVYFFFGISGFLITTRLIEEQKASGDISLKAFYWRRFFRIIPILIVFLFIIFILGHFKFIDATTNSIMSSLFLFRNYDSSPGWYTAHFWSLSMEEHYYLIWPGLFCLFIKMKKPWLPILFILGLVIIWRSVEYRYSFFAHYFGINLLRGRSDLFLDYMMWGSLTAYLNSLGTFKVIFLKYLNAWMIYPAIAFLHVLFFAAPPFHDALKAIIIQLCILLTVNFPKSQFSKILEYKWVAKIGLYSYSLYVWQQIFFTPSIHRIKGFEFFQSAPINMSLVIITAYLSYTFLETPAIAKGKKFLKLLG